MTLPILHQFIKKNPICLLFTGSNVMTFPERKIEKISKPLVINSLFTVVWSRNLRWEHLNGKTISTLFLAYNSQYIMTFRIFDDSQNLVALILVLLLLQSFTPPPPPTLFPPTFTTFYTVPRSQQCNRVITAKQICKEITLQLL